MKALLVEDEGFTREGLVLLIRNIMPDVEVTAVGSLADATRALAEKEFSFVFLDIDLNEERSGLDFLDDLKDAGVSTPVIMLSNRDAPEVVYESIRRGAFGFLPKQTEERSTLLHAVEMVVKGGVYLPPSVHSRNGMKAPPRRTPSNVTVRRAGAKDLGLSPRVYEAVFWLAQGLKNKEIAKKMDSISDNMVAEHLKNAYAKLNVNNRNDLMAMLNRRAIQLLPPERPAVNLPPTAHRPSLPGHA